MAFPSTCHWNNLVLLIFCLHLPNVGIMTCGAIWFIQYWLETKVRQALYQLSNSPGLVAHTRSNSERKGVHGCLWLQERKIHTPDKDRQQLMELLPRMAHLDVSIFPLCLALIPECLGDPASLVNVSSSLSLESFNLANQLEQDAVIITKGAGGFDRNPTFLSFFF